MSNDPQGNDQMRDDDAISREQRQNAERERQKKKKKKKKQPRKPASKRSVCSMGALRFAAWGTRFLPPTWYA